MACQYRVAGVRFGFVLEREGFQQPGLVHDFYFERHGWITGVAIMIAAYQHDFQGFVPFPPCLQPGERCWRPRCSCMQEIAKNDQLLAIMRGQQCIQALECRFGGAAWHRLVQGAIACCLPMCTSATSRARRAGQ